MDGFAFDVEVIRTGRTKSASIQLDGDKIKVSVPNRLSDTRVRELINKKSSWIEGKLKEQSIRKTIKPKEYVSGEIFTYLGRNYRMKVMQGEYSSLKLKGGYLQAVVDQQSSQKIVKSLLIDWYLEHAEKRLIEKTQRWEKIIGVDVNTIKVRDYKSRWGSCSVQGDITYNWRIIQAPHNIIDYVVIHELCHRLEHNHSKKFWKQVEKHHPTWRECREWLKKSYLYF